MRKHLELVLVSHSQDPVQTLYKGYRQCYSPGWVGEGDLPNMEGMESFLRKMRTSPHVSPLEHVSFTFAVTGFSRISSQQLTRHRIASFSQQSQRYVKMDDLDYIIPQTIANDKEAMAGYYRVIEACGSVYRDMLARNIPAEDARFVLFNGVETNLVFTMNCSALLHFFNLRCCQRAQWEIRELANRMRDLCISVLPSVFEDSGAGCEKYGVCFETTEMCCGRYPTITQLPK